MAYLKQLTVRYQQEGLALLVFVVITFYFLYPIVVQPASLVIGRPFDDAFESIWYLYWYQHALFDLKVTPLFQPDIFYPYGWDLGFAVLPPLFPTLLSPLTAVVGPVAAYNVTIIGSCLLAATGTFCLARALGANRQGAVLAGVAYAFYPNRQVYLYGFLNLLLGSMWLPWLLLGLVQAGRSPYARGRWLALSGLALALSIGGAWQSVILSTTAGVIFGFIYLGPAIRREGWGWLRPLTMAALLCLLVSGPLLINGLRVRQELGVSAVFSIENLRATSVSLERLFVPSALNPLFWRLARETFPLTNGEDGVVTLGLVSPLLAILAISRLRPWNRSVWALVILALLGLVLMLGPALHIQGRPVLLPIPATPFLQQNLPEILAPEGQVTVPLPALLLYRLLPPFRSFHHFGRWGLVSSLATASLAALGFTWLAGRHRLPRQLMLATGCLLLLALELNTQPLPSVTSTQQMERPVDKWLAARPEQSVIIEYPFSYTLKGQSLYYTIAHRQKIVHGSSLLPAGFAATLPVLSQWPAAETRDLLRELGVRYVLVHAFTGYDFEAEALPQLLAVDDLRLIDRFPMSLGPVRAIYLFELSE
ncbi:MAG: hypothetical protein AB1791_02260 [Chloroflexota bacterium]